MKLLNNSIRYSASDLVNYLGCRNITELDRQVVLGKLAPPDWRSPALELLQLKGEEFEKAYVKHLKSGGSRVFELDGKDEKVVFEVMKQGYDIITQAKLSKYGWVGIADILFKKPGRSNFGDWIYEVGDTKLARQTKAGTILQLCLYSELLGELQGVIPENMFVIKPGDGFTTETYRLPEFNSYYKTVKNRFQEYMSSDPQGIYPLPVAKCNSCRWWMDCNKKWHRDDHLCIIAGIRTNSIKELERQGIPTLETYANEPNSFREKPESGNKETFEKIHQQAKTQLMGRIEGKYIYHLLPIEPLRGLNRLPAPSEGDLYFDIEGDHFYEEGGLEYLFGISYLNDNIKLEYKSFWARDRSEEKVMFNDFMAFILKRREKYPDMHIYHYAPYEPSAVKRLASRNALFEVEIDSLLRSERFVDLFSVIKETLIASVESYSLKEIENLTGYVREADLRMASDARRRFSIALDFDAVDSLPKSDFELIELYNRDDCLATRALHHWIEKIFHDQIALGNALVRPVEKSSEASENISGLEEEARRLYDDLIKDLPADPASWTGEESSRWLLAHQVEYYRRELRSAWWEFFRLKDMDSYDLLDERKGLYGLEHVKTLPESKRVPIDRYSFPPQEVSMDVGNELFESQADKIGVVYDFSLEKRIVDIKKTARSAGIHPLGVFIKEIVPTGGLIPSLFTFVGSVLKNGMEGDGPYHAGRDLLLKNPPRLLGNKNLKEADSESFEESALRTLLDLDNSYLPIQGPPGTGKTWLGGGLIAELAKRGKKVGVTAVGHKVIRNLLDKVIERANNKGIKLAVNHKAKSGDDQGDPINIFDKDTAFLLLEQGNVIGGTAWLWSDNIFEEKLDYLFVDEAGQMALTMVLSMSRSAKNIVLLGDPRQLEQPRQGAHPEGADISALEHIIDGEQTMPPDKGLFLGTTWRLHPRITEFTSQLFYEGRLNSIEGLENQKLLGNSPFSGSGLFHVPVEHTGNQGHSHEEVEAVVKIVRHLMDSALLWSDKNGNQTPLTKSDILIIAPYNAQVSALQQALPGYSIGTVDKFQGQEAPVVIYSMTSSSSEDAPRGMSFLYNPNRTNVATSRAKCACILVSTLRIFEVECNTIEQMRWANGLCLFHDLAKEVVIQ